MTFFQIGGSVAILIVAVLAAWSVWSEYRQGRTSPMRIWTAATAPITALYCFLDASRAPWMEDKFVVVSWSIGMWALLGVVLILLEASRDSQPLPPLETPIEEPKPDEPLKPSPIHVEINR